MKNDNDNIIEVKYAVANNSIHATEPKKGASSSAGYDLFAREEKTLFLRCVTPVTIELKMEIPCDYFGKSIPDQCFWKSILLVVMLV